MQYWIHLIIFWVLRVLTNITYLESFSNHISSYWKWSNLRLYSDWYYEFISLLQVKVKLRKNIAFIILFVSSS